MKLKTVRETYDYFSGTASEVARHLAFAGIAVVWLFTVVSEGTLILSTSLLFGVFFFVLALSLDLLHYSIAAALWGGYARKHEHKLVGEVKQVRSNDEDIPDPSKRINWPALGFFWSKIVAVTLGYISLLVDLVGRISVS